MGAVGPEQRLGGSLDRPAGAVGLRPEGRDGVERGVGVSPFGGGCGRADEALERGVELVFALAVGTSNEHAEYDGRCSCFAFARGSVDAMPRRYRPSSLAPIHRGGRSVPSGGE